MGRIRAYGAEGAGQEGMCLGPFTTYLMFSKTIGKRMAN